MPQHPTTASLRKVLDRVLISDSDLDAFCLDHFPKIKRGFTNGMDRVAKVNRLLEGASATAILDCLRDGHAATLAACEQFLRYEEAAPADPDPPAVLAPPPPAPPQAAVPAPGQRIGKYRIE